MSLLTLLSAAAAQQADIPASSFLRGSGSVPDETPQRTISLSAYRIDHYEVTVAQFQSFMAGPSSTQAHWSLEGWAWHQANPQGAGDAVRSASRALDHPVVGVTWYEADAYCRWKGGALPTEAQWEHASCGEGDPAGHRFAWGTGEDVDAVWYSGGKYGHITGVLTEPVQSVDDALRSPFGLAHATGNVWEWTADWYHREGYAEGPDADPTGPERGTWKTMRGGSFMNLPSYSTCTHREPARPERVALTVGFRCAYSQ
ncbi:MAG: SUMF1/EgtB/PvdO family nonheme iron enzyme [Myxococcota bacterium]|nr:SUMF1/EgtB/PvdO family nonheme iron enzyme [Myxococcota bacterium]